MSRPDPQASVRLALSAFFALILLLPVSAYAQTQGTAPDLEGIFETEHRDNPHYDVTTWRTLEIGSDHSVKETRVQEGTSSGRGCADFKTIREGRYEVREDGTFEVFFENGYELVCGKREGDATRTVGPFPLTVTDEGVTIEFPYDGRMLYRSP